MEVAPPQAISGLDGYTGLDPTLKAGPPRALYRAKNTFMTPEFKDTNSTNPLDMDRNYFNSSF